MLLNDRDPVRWYESVKNTILQVVGWINGPATRYNQDQPGTGCQVPNTRHRVPGSRYQGQSARCKVPGTISVTRFNPIMQLLLKLSGQGAISVVPAVSC